MKKFIIVSFYKPFVTYSLLFQHQKKVAFSFLLILILGILYTFTVVMGYNNGFGAVVTPFLSIQPEKYYFYQAFFCIPIFFIIAIIFAGTSRLLSFAIGGKGIFEDNFVIYCTASLVPTIITMWVPETVLIVFFPDLRAAPLGGFNMIPAWLDIARQIIGVVWPMIISIIGINVSEKVGVLKSIVVSTASFIVCASIMIIFIR